MKRITLTASEVVDGSKVELGRQENFPIPETVDEVVEMSNLDDGCDEEEIVACFVYGWKVKSQAKLRAGAGDKTPLQIFKKAGGKNQDKIIELAKQAGLL